MKAISAALLLGLSPIVSADQLLPDVRGETMLFQELLSIVRGVFHSTIDPVSTEAALNLWNPLELAGEPRSFETPLPNGPWQLPTPEFLKPWNQADHPPVQLLEPWNLNEPLPILLNWHR